MSSGKTEGAFKFYSSILILSRWSAKFGRATDSAFAYYFFIQRICILRKKWILVHVPAVIGVVRSK